MITGNLKNQVDAIWEMFWSNGVSNPLTVIEHMSYLIFMRALDDVHTARERKARRLGRELQDPVFGADEQDLRWSSFKNEGDAGKVYELVSGRLFDFIKRLGAETPEGTPSSFAKHMADAVFLVPQRILVPVIEKVAELPLTDRDTKGDLYEYMLSKLSQAGQNGQFRTPRHIIRMMVDLVEPTPQDTNCDPACGTAGFLVSAAEYLREHHPKVQSDPELWEHFRTRAFAGFDFDATMLRIASMNLYLHGIEDPDIDARDSLSQDYARVEEEYSLVLANPPFTGSIGYVGTAENLLSVLDAGNDVIRAIR